jgi:transglutaminase-like putative cysteine protease
MQASYLTNPSSTGTFSVSIEAKNGVGSCKHSASVTVL